MSLGEDSLRYRHLLSAFNFQAPCTQEDYLNRVWALLSFLDSETRLAVAQIKLSTQSHNLLNPSNRSNTTSQEFGCVWNWHGMQSMGSMKEESLSHTHTLTGYKTQILFGISNSEASGSSNSLAPNQNYLYYLYWNGQNPGMTLKTNGLVLTGWSYLSWVHSSRSA